VDADEDADSGAIEPDSRMLYGDWRCNDLDRAPICAMNARVRVKTDPLADGVELGLPALSLPRVRMEWPLVGLHSQEEARLVFV